MIPTKVVTRDAIIRSVMHHHGLTEEEMFQPGKVRRDITDARRDAALRLSEAGFRKSSIARILRLAKQTVGAYFRRKKVRANGRIWTAAEKRTLDIMVSEGRSQKEIAAALNRSKTAVNSYISNRGRGERYAARFDAYLAAKAVEVAHA